MTVNVPTTEEILRRINTPEAPSLMTSLGLIEGDVLAYVEEHGATTVRRLIRELEWSAPMVMMAVGALVREGLVRATQHDLEVIVELLPPRSSPERNIEWAAPEVWGG